MYFTCYCQLPKYIFIVEFTGKIVPVLGEIDFMTLPLPE